MTTPVVVHEPIVVQARFSPDGKVQPNAFIWRNRTRYVADIGRQWQEPGDNGPWQCYLVQSPVLETFELRHEPASGRWLLERAWLHDALA